MNAMKTTLSGAALMAMAACGGASTNSATLGASGQASEFMALAGDFDQSLQSVGLAETDVLGPPSILAFTTPAQRPPVGSAAYSGEMALFVANEVASVAANDTEGGSLSDVESLLLGEVEITATFATNGGTLTGSATNFVDEDGAFSGALVFADGVLIQGGGALQTASNQRFGSQVSAGDVVDNNPDTTGFLSDFGGTLTDQNGMQTSFDGATAGALVGPDASLVGIVSGGATSAGQATEFFGLLVATQ